jgi:opacity protein-like surface antigen
MKTKLTLCLLCFFFISQFSNAQENELNSINPLFEFEEPVDRWNVGLTFQALIGFREIKSGGRNYDSFDEGWIGLGVGFYADYKINQVWKLRAEAGINAYVGFDPYLNIQSEFQFTDRWSFYAGAGTYFNTRADHLVQRDENGTTILNPFIQLGLRYKMSKSWTVDLRYQQDLYARKRATNFNNFNKDGPLSTFSLGFNYRF